MLLSNLGDVLADQGDFCRPHLPLSQGLEIARQIGNRQSEGIGLGSLGIVSHRQGDYAAARDYLEQGLALFRQIGNRWAEAVGLIHLGEVISQPGGAERGPGILYTKAWILQFRSATRRNKAKPTMDWGRSPFDEAEYAAASKHYLQSLELARQIGDRKAEGETLHNLAQTSWRWESGKRPDLLPAGLNLHQELNQPQHLAEDLAALASLAWKGGNKDDARARLDTLLPILAANPGLEGAQHPQRAILSVVRILEAAGMERAASVLTSAQEYLRTRAASLPDEAARHFFLESAPENQELLAAVCCLPPEEATAPAAEEALPPAAEPEAQVVPHPASEPKAKAPAQPAPQAAPTGVQPPLKIKNLDQAGLSRLLTDLAQGGIPGAVIVINIEHVTIENINVSGTRPSPADEAS